MPQFTVNKVLLSKIAAINKRIFAPNFVISAFKNGDVVVNCYHTEKEIEAKDFFLDYQEDVKTALQDVGIDAAALSELYSKFAAKAYYDLKRLTIEFYQTGTSYSSSKNNKILEIDPKKKAPDFGTVTIAIPKPKNQNIDPKKFHYQKNPFYEKRRNT